MKKTLGIILLSAVTSVLSVITYNHFTQDNTKSEIPQISENTNNNVNYRNVSLPTIDVDLKTAAKNSVDAVVHIKKYEENSYTTFRDLFFGFQPKSMGEQVYGFGSGVIISDDGYIITNNHVIENNSHIEVVLNNDKSYNAVLIGTDPETDIALLKIDENNLPYLKYGDSDLLEIGDWVLAVGNPFNLTSTVTAGIVSAKARNLGMNNRSVESFIQTDAAVNPGNSGGALVNTKGELVGINSMIYSRNGGYMGYSFAIPINIVDKIVKDLMEYGTVQRAYLGIATIDVNDPRAKSIGIYANKGVGVAYVDDNFAAGKAGIIAGDVITKINGKPIKNKSEMQEIFVTYRPGQKVKITVLRNSKEIDFDIVLTNKNGDTSYIKTTSIDALGAKFEEISSIEKKKYGLSNGIKVKSIGAGKLRLEGVKEGFIIITVNRKIVNTADDIKKIIDSESNNGGILIEGIYPNGRRGYYAIGLN